MTHYIAHRINTIQQLEEVPHDLGTEIDLRDRGERLILQHDPFVDGEDAEPFFAKYKHGTLILNIKSERIEYRVLELMKKYGIENYFFLDSSFPMIFQLSKIGEKRTAVRFSEFESVDTVLKLEGLVDWIWVDCFTVLPISKELYAKLKECGFRLCLVSPELQGRPEDIPLYRDRLKADGIEFDAICCKKANMPLWQEAFPN
ncbi:MAG: hypothetical protein K2X93_13405 [Candidatus Obscuribacterales bacterium]|nr:hypothetical protein [Candidatus Obscuribacterales bacterium]